MVRGEWLACKSRAWQGLRGRSVEQVGESVEGIFMFRLNMGGVGTFKGASIIHHCVMTVSEGM